VFPQEARAMEKAIRTRQEKREYDGITNQRQAAGL
jgi:hypothetical protein